MCIRDRDKTDSQSASYSKAIDWQRSKRPKMTRTRILYAGVNAKRTPVAFHPSRPEVQLGKMGVQIDEAGVQIDEMVVQKVQTTN